MSPSSGIDRRDFLRAGAAAVLLGSTAGASRALAAPVPRTGGVLRIGVNIPTTEIPDPARATTQFIAPNLFEPPVRADPLFNLRPAGCSDWSPNRDASVWTFKVRREARFSNGRRITAADYAYSIRRLLDPATLSPYTTALTPFLAPSGIHAPDARTLRFQLRQPHAFWDVLLSGQQFGVIPAGWRNFDRPLGSGPFALQSFQAGTYAVLIRNRHYWRTGRPYVDGVQVIALPQESARLQSLFAGDVDIADALPTSGPALAESKTARPVVLRGGTWAGVHFLGNQAPFTSPLVREAVQYSMNRLEFLQSVSSYGHHFVTPDFEVVPPGDPFYPVGLKAKHYDPERARSLLQQAGLGDGLKTTIYCANGNITNSIAVWYQSIARASNIDLEIVPMPGQVFNATIPGKQNIARGGQRQHAYVALASNYFTGGATNYTYYSNPRFDKLFRRFLATPNDEAKQRELVADMCALVSRTWAGVEAGVFDRVIGRGNDVQGLNDVRSVVDDVWLA